ncbi:MAG: DUF6252 family protein [Ferruginibacter sp.]
MKLIRMCIALLAITLFYTACERELSEENGGTPTGGGGGAVVGDFRAKFDGTQWVANRLTGASRMGGLINITGLSTNGQVLTITLTDSGVHQYYLYDTTMNAAALVDSTLPNRNAFGTNQGTTAQSGGVVNITAIDAVNKRISGTFSFKVYRAMDSLQRTITDGVFTNTSYSTTMPPSSATDTMYVDIDGSTYRPVSVTGLANSGNIIINGTDATASKTVGLTFPETTIPGTYTLDFFGLVYIGLYNPNSTTALASSSGNLEILENNATTRRIRGRFSFVAEPLLGGTSVNLTNGYFSVRY